MSASGFDLQNKINDFMLRQFNSVPFVDTQPGDTNLLTKIRERIDRLSIHVHQRSPLSEDKIAEMARDDIQALREIKGTGLKNQARTMITAIANMIPGYKEVVYEHAPQIMVGTDTTPRALEQAIAKYIEREEATAAAGKISSKFSNTEPGVSSPLQHVSTERIPTGEDCKREGYDATRQQEEAAKKIRGEYYYYASGNLSDYPPDLIEKMVMQDLKDYEVAKGNAWTQSSALFGLESKMKESASYKASIEKLSPNIAAAVHEHSKLSAQERKSTPKPAAGPKL